MAADLSAWSQCSARVCVVLEFLVLKALQRNCVPYVEMLSPPEKPSSRGGGDGLAVSAERGRRTASFDRKQYVCRLFLYLPGSLSLGLKLATHLKNIQVIFILSLFKLIPNAAAKGLPSTAGLPGVLKRCERVNKDTTTLTEHLGCEIQYAECFR